MRTRSGGVTVRVSIRVLILVLACAAAAAIAFAVLRYASLTLRVAVPAAPREAHELQALARDISTENRWIALRRVPATSMEEGARLLTRREADVTVLRSDLETPPDAAAIAILRHDDIFLLVAPKSPIESFADLRGRTVGLLPGGPDNRPLLDRILTFYDVAPASVRTTAVTPAEAGQAIRQKTIDAVLVVGPAGKGAAAEAYASLARAAKGAPEIVGIEEADALAARFPSFEAETIAKGTFAGASPDEDLATVKVADRVLVRKDMNTMVAGELARILISARSRLPGDASTEGIEAPDTEQNDYAVHPGAKLYVDGEQPSLFDRFESLFWIFWIVAAVIGSVLTWAAGWVRGQRETQGRELGRLAAFLSEVRRAEPGRLEELGDELDRVVAHVITEHQEGRLDADELGIYQIALEHARRAIDERRAILDRIPAQPFRRAGGESSSIEALSREGG